MWKSKGQQERERKKSQKGKGERKIQQRMNEWILNKFHWL